MAQPRSKKYGKYRKLGQEWGGAPGHHFYFFETHGFSGITGGLSAAILGEKRPTIGLSEIGSMHRRARRASAVSESGVASRCGTVASGVDAWGELAGRAWRPPWAHPARLSRRDGSEFAGRRDACSRTHVPERIAVRLQARSIAASSRVTWRPHIDA